MRSFVAAILVFSFAQGHTQVLVDSIPYPGSNFSFWGIHVSTDTIFLGADGAGDVHFSDPTGALLGQQATGYNYCHGLIKRASSYLIAKDYTGSGALLHEVDLSGNTLNTWTFPPVIGGNSSGIGDICADGDAIWYTMYFPDFDTYPYAYAYKWIPGDPTPIDTVPLRGEQPYGIALKGDTLLYVTDNLNDDPERIYSYDLTNEVDLDWVELPDTPIDNDMSPRGMFYDGDLLYLVANRQGGSAFAYQTVYLFDFVSSLNTPEISRANVLHPYPNPSNGSITLELPNALGDPNVIIGIFDAQGRTVYRTKGHADRITMDVHHLSPGTYQIRTEQGKVTSEGTFVIPE